MAVANTLFAMLTARYNEAMLLADDIYLQISSLKRSTDNAELDRLHTLYHHAHDAPATGEEQKIALMLVCPGFNECSNPCVVGKVCEVYTYVSWNSGDVHKRECGWALYNLQGSLHAYFACGAVQRGSMGWNGRIETWQDLVAYHVLGMQLVIFFLFNPIVSTFWVYCFRARLARAISATEDFVQTTLQLPVEANAVQGGMPGPHHEPAQAAGVPAPESPNRWSRRRQEREDDQAWERASDDQAWRWKQWKGSWFFYCSCMDCWVKQKMETRAYCNWSNEGGWREWNGAWSNQGNSWRWQ